MRTIALAVILAAAASVSAHEIEIPPPRLEVSRATIELASDGVEAVAVWSDRATRITADGRAVNPVGEVVTNGRAATIAYAAGVYLETVKLANGVDALLLDRDARPLATLHLFDGAATPVSASNGTTFLVAAGNRAVTVDAGGNVIGNATLSGKAIAAASDGADFLVVTQQTTGCFPQLLGADVVTPAGAVRATQKLPELPYCTTVTAAAFDGTEYVVASYSDRPRLQRVDRNGAPAGEAIALPGVSLYPASIRALSLGDEALVLWSQSSGPAVAVRVRNGAATTESLELLDRVSVAPIAAGLFAASSRGGGSLWTRELRRVASDAIPLALAAPPQQLAAVASNGSEVLAVWTENGFDGYAAVIGPRGVSQPIALGNVAREYRASTNGRDFLVALTGGFGSLFVWPIGHDGTAGSRITVAGPRTQHGYFTNSVLWAAGSWLVPYVDQEFSHAGTITSGVVRLRDGATAVENVTSSVRGAGSILSSHAACSPDRCLGASVVYRDGQGAIDGVTLDASTLATSFFEIVDEVALDGTSVDGLVFDGAAFRLFITRRERSEVLTLAADGTLLAARDLPRTFGATFAVDSRGTLIARQDGEHEVALMRLDRAGALAILPPLHSDAAIRGAAAAVSWLGDAVVYAHDASDAQHGTTTRLFLRPLPGRRRNIAH